MRRICMAGPSGTGKSTLAKALAEHYKIPYITTSTKPLWDKYEIKSHSDLIQKAFLNPQWGKEFQDEVLQFRIDALKGAEEFVTDRSPIDNIAYFLLQNSASLGEEDTEKYIYSCMGVMDMFSHIILLPFTDLVVLEPDGKRIANKYYQMMVNGTFSVTTQIAYQMMNPKSTLQSKAIHIWEWDKRFKEATNFIEGIKA